MSSPNAEGEAIFCSQPSKLNANMCSKIDTSSANITTALATSPPNPALTGAPNAELVASDCSGTDPPQNEHIPSLVGE